MRRLRYRLARWLLADLFDEATRFVVMGVVDDVIEPRIADAEVKAAHQLAQRSDELKAATDELRRDCEKLATGVRHDINQCIIRDQAIAHHVAPVMPKQRHLWLQRLDARIKRTFAEHEEKLAKAAEAAKGEASAPATEDAAP